MPPDQQALTLPTALRPSLVAIAERLLPEDEHGPGAVRAGAVAYVLQALAGDDAAFLPAYVAGLQAVDARAREAHGAPFAELTSAAQDALLAGMEGEAFFELVRTHVFEGMFGDPSYGGNRDGAGWKLLGYTGPQAVWTEAEQRVMPA